MSAYQKENGKWYELRKIDNASEIEVEVPAPEEVEIVEVAKPKKAK